MYVIEMDKMDRQWPSMEHVSMSLYLSLFLGCDFVWRVAVERETESKESESL